MNERTARHGMAGLVDDDTGLSCIDVGFNKKKKKNQKKEAKKRKNST